MTKFVIVSAIMTKNIEKFIICFQSKPNNCAYVTMTSKVHNKGGIGCLMTLIIKSAFCRVCRLCTVAKFVPEVGVSVSLVYLK